MTDEFARLESALRATSPRAPEGARERAITEAMAAFDRHHQGMGDGARQKGQVPKRGTSWIRRLVMPTQRTSFALAGSAAVLVVAGIVSHQVLVTPQPPPLESPRPVESPRPASPDRTTTATADAPAAGTGVRAPSPEEQAEIVKVEVDVPLPEEPAESVEEIVSRYRAPDLRTLAESAERAESGEEVVPESAPAASAPAPEAFASSGYSDVDSKPLWAPTSKISSASGTPEAVPVESGPAFENYVLLPEVEGLAASAPEPGPDHYREQGRDRFTSFDPNPVKVVAEEPVSTFSIDVDTAAYGFMRASLHRGRLPERDAVRIEELINYFPYDYAPPRTPDTPFAAHVSLMPAPWNDATRLMHVGIEGYAPQRHAAPRANLVFLIDTSGSMDAPDKLPLLINSFKLLLGALAPEDRVAIVAYAGSAGVVLPPTPVAERATILAGLERLHAAGSTAGAEGIRQAYRLAAQHRVEDGVNRVILATDGDFNVGITDLDELESYIAGQRASGVFLSVLGFGMGNYNDALMQRLAQHGNGNAAYIDTLSEARKVLVEEGTSTLFPIAKDVKIQVEFNPAAVSEYRLIGYETRMLAREDFRNDKVDAGEIGAGHTVTAIYEVTPAGSGAERIAPLRYRREEAAEAADAGADFDGELAFVKIRYKLPDADTSTLITRPVTLADGHESVAAAPPDARFAAAVAGFGQLLRGGRYTGGYGYGDVIALAQGARGEDPFGYRAEFIDLVRLARSTGFAE